MGDLSPNLEEAFEFGTSIATVPISPSFVEDDKELNPFATLLVVEDTVVNDLTETSLSINTPMKRRNCKYIMMVVDH